MSFEQNRIFSREPLASFLASTLLHAGLLVGGGAVFAQGAQYAVDLGAGGIEVNLVAAPLEPVVTELIEIPQLPKKVVPALEPEDASLLQIPQEEKPPAETKKAQIAPASAITSIRGDGSSLIPGQDATTLQSMGGALMEAKPNYLRNPAPPYPHEARKNGWEGLVVLRVAVDRSGRSGLVEIENSSGYAPLDQSALRTVQRWKFSPARLGSLPVDSTVRVPVRFKLEPGN